MRNKIKGVEQSCKNAEKRYKSAYKQPTQGSSTNEQKFRETLKDSLLIN